MIKAIDFTNNEVLVEYDNVRRYYLTIADLDNMTKDINRAKLMLIHRPVDDLYCANCQVAPVKKATDWCQECIDDPNYNGGLPF